MSDDNYCEFAELPKSHESEDIMECEQVNVLLQENNEFEWDNLEVYNISGIQMCEESSKKRGTKRFCSVPLEQNNTSTENEYNEFQVIITSIKDMLPKQVALAKLLKSENVKNIISINYKSPYKVNIIFDKEIEARSLINNENFEKRGYRAKMYGEINLTYGIVKRIETEVGEDEFMQEFKCQQKIENIKRLKRYSAGQWVDSETIRVCFKSPVLPEYIIGYGCRFKVEPYTFPVTQCSGCWRFGHIKRTCPTKKMLCPKCGQAHQNCDTTQFKCINCSGNHMSLDKSCPIFLKEKDIRNIMSEQNCTYKKAYEIQQGRDKATAAPITVLNRNIDESDGPTTLPTLSRAYRDALMNKRVKYNSEDSSEEGTKTTHQKFKKDHKKRKNQKPKLKTSLDKNVEENTCQNVDLSNLQSSSKVNNESKNKFEFKKLFKKIQEIIMSEAKFEEKLTSILKYIISEISYYFINTVKEGNLLHKMFNIFNDE